MAVGIGTEDWPNAANDAAAAAAAAAEDDDTVFPNIAAEDPRVDDNEDDKCSFTVEDSSTLPPTLPGITTEGYKFWVPFELMEVLFWDDAEIC